MSRMTALLALLCPLASTLAQGPEIPRPPAAPLSLQDCIALARCTHEDAIVAAARVREAEAGTDGARADRLPTVGLTGSGTVGELLPPSAGGVAATSVSVSQSSLTLGLNWSIFDLRRPKLIERARKLEDQARAGAVGTLRDLDLRVANAYIDHVRARHIAELNAAIHEADAERLRMAAARERIGDGTQLETMQARAQEALSAEGALTARNAAEQSRLALLSAMGLAHEADFVFALDPPPAGATPLALEQSLDNAYERRDDILSLQRALDVSHVDVALARLARRVSFELTAGGQKPIVSSGDQATSYQIAFTASLPLFDGGAARSQLRAAEARKIISEAEVAAALRTTWLEVTGAWRDVESARERVAASAVGEDAARQSLEKTQTAYRIGVSSFADLLTAREQQYQARQQAIEAEAALSRALWALHRASPGSVEGLLTLPPAGEEGTT